MIVWTFAPTRDEYHENILYNEEWKCDGRMCNDGEAGPCTCLYVPVAIVNGRKPFRVTTTRSDDLIDEFDDLPF